MIGKTEWERVLEAMLKAAWEAGLKAAWELGCEAGRAMERHVNVMDGISPGVVGEAKVEKVAEKWGGRMGEWD
jgi:hypothetical protein